MAGVRSILAGKGQWAVLLIMLALAVKMVVPQGFMLATPAPLTLQVMICAPVSGEQDVTVTIPMTEESQKKKDTLGEKAEPCSFSALGQGVLGGASAVLLALAFAVILLLGLAPQRRLPFGPALHIRPPLRGPPAAA